MENVPIWGVVIGRFQVDDLHEGHIALLDHVKRTHEQLLILVGVRPALPSDKHPLSFKQRELMLKTAYPKATIIPISDMRTSDVWSKNVDNNIRITTENKKAVIYTGRDGFSDRYSGTYNVKKIDFGFDFVTATDARNVIPTAKNSADFRAGVISTRLHAPSVTLMTVDMAVLNPEGDKVLMARKPNEYAWRFPGGMFDAGSDLSFEAAASRETYEETNIIVAHDEWKYLGNFPVQDWRSSDTDKQHWHTMFFMAQLPWMDTIRAKDDIVEVEWIRLTSPMATSNNLVQEHWDLWTYLQKNLLNPIDRNAKENTHGTQ